MIYLVTTQTKLFNSDYYELLSIEESLKMINSWNVIQFDTETKGRDAHIGKLLTMQFGNKDKSIQIVVDCSTVDPVLYKNVLEEKLVIGQNLKFDFFHKFIILLA